MFEEVIEFTPVDIGVKSTLIDLKNIKDVIYNQVAPISKNQCIVSNNYGEIVIFSHDESSDEFYQTLLQDMTSQSNFEDIKLCSSLGGVLMASSTNLNVLYPNGYQTEILGTQPLANKPEAVIRVAPDESCLGLNINLNGYEAIKIYPNLKSHRLEESDSITIKLFSHNPQDCNDDMVNDFQFTKTARLVGATSRGILSIWDYTGNQITSHPVFNWQEVPARIDNIQVSQDSKFACVLTSTGTSTLRAYTLSVFKIEGDIIEEASSTLIREGSKGCWVATFYQKSDGSYVAVVTNDFNDVRFYQFNNDGKELKWVHTDNKLQYGPKSSNLGFGYLWVVDKRSQVLRISAEGL